MSTINNINLLGRLKLKSHLYTTEQLITRLEADNAVIIRVNQLPTEDINQNAVYIKNKVLNFYDGSNWISVTGKNLKIIPITLNNETTSEYSISWNERIVTITHNLNSRIVGSLYNPQNQQIFLGIDYVDQNTITINFTNVSIDSINPYTLCLFAQQLYVGSLGYDYNSLLNKPTIPTKLSDLTDDSSFVKTSDLNSEGLKIIPITSSDVSTANYTITWNNNVATITHNLNSRVIGALYNTDNEQIFIGINYINNNSVSIDFSDITLTNNDQFTLLLTAQQVYNNLGYRLKDITLLDNTTIDTLNSQNFLYNLEGNETFIFNNAQENKILSFRLYLKMPSTLVSFTWPLNILWESEPNITQTDSLYSFVFEWNPIIKKWLGNQFWEVINISSSSSSSNSSSSSSNFSSSSSSSSFSSSSSNSSSEI